MQFLELDFVKNIPVFEVLLTTLVYLLVGLSDMVLLGYGHPPSTFGLLE
jgi:uncharacterized membrane protein YuzA (DUF378 family)